MKRIGFLLVLFFVLQQGHAEVINVPGNASTIQGGIDLASNGDTVLISQGNYNENIDFNGKTILVASYHFVSGDTSYIQNTIIGGNSAAAVVTFNLGEGSTSILWGFTISNGFYRHGILCDGASPTIRNCIVSNNHSEGYGGGGVACINGASPKFIHLDAKNNYAAFGGGIYATSGIMIDSSIISNNHCYAGAGVYISGNGAIIKNTIISNNYAFIPFGEGSCCGGGIYCIGHDLTITGCKILNNSCSGIDYLTGYGAGIYIDGNNCEISYCIFSGNVIGGQLIGYRVGAYGGGLYSAGINNIAYNLFYNNVCDASAFNGIPGAATAYGGAIFVDDGYVENNTVYSNSCNSFIDSNDGKSRGGGIWNKGSAIIENNTVIGNSVTGNGIVEGGGYGGTLDYLCCNDVWNNTPTDVEDTSVTTFCNNISVDPLFCHPELEDYEIYSISPCAPNNSPDGCGLIGAFEIGCMDYITGDANGDGNINVSDAVYIINYVFIGGAAPDPIESGDANCDGSVNVSDSVYIINYIFTGGNAPGDPDGDGIPDC